MCRPASVLRFAARWRALYAALQMGDTLAGHKDKIRIVYAIIMM